MGRVSPILIALVVGAAVCSLRVAAAKAQADSGEGVEELVVNQAAGRVVIAVVKNAILICTSETPIEPQSRPPVPVELSSLRSGTILGAVEWYSPSLQKNLGRLDQELPQLRSVTDTTPHIGAGATNQQAGDIEAIGKPLRNRLAELAGDIHSDLSWPKGQPLLELVIADYLQDYGPEVWQLTYTLSQEQQKGDYWVTNIDPPVYLQIWPPEKGQPHTLMEFDYPATGATLLDMLKKNEPRLSALIHADARLADTASKFLSGDSMKISSADATQFLRAAMTAVTPSTAPQTAAVIRPEMGFDWILAPPAEPKPPRNGQRTSEPNAPSLAHPPSRDDSRQAPSPANPPR